MARERGASVSAAASSSLLPQLLGADEHQREQQDEDEAGNGAQSVAAAAAGDDSRHVCRTTEPDTAGSDIGASRSGQGSPDDVIRSPGSPSPAPVFAPANVKCPQLTI